MQQITLTIGDTILTTGDATLAHHVMQHLLPQASEIAAAPTASCQPITPPPLGSYWEGQGGVFAGTLRGRDGHPDYHLIVAAGPDGEAEEISWGGRGKQSEATSAWDGLTNTRTLVDSEINHPAAQWAAGLQHEGHDDWYLPAQAELAMAWANVPELFSGGWHWSSSQFSAYSAWSQCFHAGGQLNDATYLECRARAVRRLIIQ